MNGPGPYSMIVQRGNVMRERLRFWGLSCFWWLVNFVAGFVVAGVVVAVHLWL